MSAAAAHDSQAIGLLCAPISVGEAKPLTPSEWAKLAPLIHASELERPAALVGLTATELGHHLGLPDELAERLAALLERGGTLAFELERLESRGIRMIARTDEEYPKTLKQRLKLRAPAVLFVAGRAELVPGRAVAVVGSRDASPAALAFADELGRCAAREYVAVVSGAARGVDRAAMAGALEAGGTAVGVVADSLVRVTQQPDIRTFLADGALALLTPYAPEARFSVGAAMGRNRLIYCLADAAVVVATSAGSGGTWAGAIENLKAGWAPLWIWSGEDAPVSNRALAAEGARPLATYRGLDELREGADQARLASESSPPDLLSFLAMPRTERQVADALGLSVGVARKLLREGIASGAFSREGRPFRYVAANQGQPALFDAN